MLAYFKNQFLHESECHVSIHDRSFRFGDGIFDTSLVVNGQIYDFASHLKRIQKGLTAYKINLDTSNVEAICYELIKKNNVRNGYVRVIISRGENGANSVGYLPGDSKPYLLITSMEKPYPAFKEISLFVASQQSYVKQPSKTNNSLFYTLALMEAQEHGCDNALLMNKDGHICETASGNIFWIKDDILYTPDPALELISGTMRAKILGLWQGHKTEGKFTLKDLENADEVFMTNIGYLMAPVTKMLPAGNQWPIGKNTTDLRQKLDSAIIKETSAEIAGN